MDFYENVATTDAPPKHLFHISMCRPKYISPASLTLGQYVDPGPGKKRMKSNLWFEISESAASSKQIRIEYTFAYFSRKGACI